MDRETHTADTWTGGTLIGPDTEEYILCSVVLTSSPCIDNQYYLRVTIGNWVTLTRAGKQ